MLSFVTTLMPTEYSGGRCLGWMWYLYNDFWFFVVLVFVVALFTKSEMLQKIKATRVGKITKILAWTILSFFILFSPIYRTWLNAVCGVYVTNMGIFYQGWITFSYNATSEVCSNKYWRDDYYNPLPRASAYANFWYGLKYWIVTSPSKRYGFFPT